MSGGMHLKSVRSQFFPPPSFTVIYVRVRWGQGSESGEGGEIGGTRILEERKNKWSQDRVRQSFSVNEASHLLIC